MVIVQVFVILVVSPLVFVGLQYFYPGELTEDRLRALAAIAPIAWGIAVNFHNAMREAPWGKGLARRQRERLRDVGVEVTRRVWFVSAVIVACTVFLFLLPIFYTDQRSLAYAGIVGILIGGPLACIPVLRSWINQLSRFQEELRSSYEDLEARQRVLSVMDKAHSVRDSIPPAGGGAS